MPIDIEFCTGIEPFYGNTVWGCGLDSSGSGQGALAASCEHGNEHSGYTRDVEFPETVSGSQEVYYLLV
jgi:hypothetical protein